VHHRFKRHWWQICHQVNTTDYKFTTGPVVTPFQRFLLTTGVFDIGFKFATGISMTTAAANLPPVSTAECHQTG
jgi:hypothetical protein